MAFRLGPHTLAALKGLDAEGASSQLQLHFPDVTIKQPKTEILAAAAQTAPTLSIANSLVAGGNGVSPKRFISLCIDLDAPFPSFAFMSPILHGFQSDLIASTSTDGSNDYAPLVSEVPPMALYGPPRPPPISSAHHYVFVLWEQPSGLDTDSIKKILGYTSTMSLWNRIRWDGKAFEKALGLGPVVAAASFMAKAS